MPRVGELTHIHARAYAALGLATVLAAEPGNVAVADALRSAVTPIAEAYHEIAGPDWGWCEPVMTYDLGRIPESLIRAGLVLSDHGLLTAGLEMLNFYAGIVIEDGMFVPVGNDGWYPRGGERARFGQQPLEAAAFVDASLAALAATGDETYRRFSQIAYDWFFRSEHSWFFDGDERRLPRRHRSARRQSEHGRGIDACVSHERDRTRGNQAAAVAYRALAHPAIGSAAFRSE